MRLAIVSDIHGNLPALEAVVRDFERRGVDHVINLGDSLSGPLLPLETARYLMASGWVHLAGNHERQVLTGGPGRWNQSDEFTFGQLTDKELAWMATLTPCQPFGDDVLLCHGTPASDVGYFLETVERSAVRLASSSEIEERLGETAASLIVCGHTHVPRAVRSLRGQLIVNPGSVGLPAYNARHPEPHVIENGSPDARYALVERRDDGWVSSLLSVPYDHAAMARLAAERQRHDWAHALSSGYAQSR